MAFGLAITEIGEGLRLYRGHHVGQQYGLRGRPGYWFGREKKKYIPKIASGEYYAGGFGLTETTAGSDPAGMRCSAVLDGNDYVLNGNKLFITSAEYAGVFVVWAITRQVGSQREGDQHLS